MKKSKALTLALVLAASCAAAYGQPAGGPAKGPGKGQGPSSEQFSKIKAEMLKGHQARAQILQQSESCIQGAQDINALKACHEQEREAHRKLQEQMKSEWQALRQAGQRGGQGQQGK